jgi:hypothetical protein
MRLERYCADDERTEDSFSIYIAYFLLCLSVMYGCLSDENSPPSLSYFPSHSPFRSEFPFLLS